MEYLQHYEFEEDVPEDFTALEGSYDFSISGNIKSDSKMIIVSYHAIPIFRDRYSSETELVGRIPGKLEVFNLKIEKIILIFSLEKFPANENLLATSIWKNLAVLSKNVTVIDCYSGLGDETELWFDGDRNNDFDFSGFKVRKLDHDIPKSEIVRLAKNDGKSCQIFSLSFQGFRPSVRGLIDFSNLIFS